MKSNRYLHCLRNACNNEVIKGSHIVSLPTRDTLKPPLKLVKFRQTIMLSLYFSIRPRNNLYNKYACATIQKKLMLSRKITPMYFQTVISLTLITVKIYFTS